MLRFSLSSLLGKDGTGAEKKYQADRDTYRQVDEDGYANYLHYFLV